MRKALPLAFAVLVLALPAGATAQVVPPGNSAAAQYTETFPSSKGEEDTQGSKKQVSPNQVIGSQKTKKLKEQGPEGAAVAEFTAETAPETSSAGEESTAGEGTDSNGGGKQGSGNGKADGKGKADGAGNADSAGKGKSSGQGTGGGEEGSAAAGGAAAGGNSGGPGPSGSSAVGEVASQATGVSSGALGLWLPIVLVAVLAWAGFMVWRRRQGPERAV